jgi:hypothetical protein
MSIRDLPAEAKEALAKLSAPPRLIRHHEVVHEVACRLVEGLLKKYPETPFFNGRIVAFGASIHDIGKVSHPEEITGPGEKHEKAGPKVLEEVGLKHGNCFARLHSVIKEFHKKGEIEMLATEVIMVALADVIWKGARDNDLEALLVGRITKATLVGSFEADAALDRIIGSISGHADQFLEYCR